MWFRRTLVSSYSSVMRAIANSFAQKSMKQISVSPVLVSDEKELLAIIKEGLAFFSNHTIKDRNTKKKNWSGGVDRKGCLKNWLKIQNLVLRDTRLKPFLTISFNDFERRHHGSQRLKWTSQWRFKRITPIAVQIKSLISVEVYSLWASTYQTADIYRKIFIERLLDWI